MPSRLKPSRPVLTRKQKLVLDFITAFIDKHGYHPSYGEIARGLGLAAQSTVCVHVENLRQKGYLARKWNAKRSADPVTERTPASATEEVPLAGLIAAGLPIEAVPDNQTIGIPSDMLGKNDTYVLQVKGDSMIDAHVMDGDYVVVSRQQWAHDGDMVVALVRGSEVTLKRFRRRKDKIVLEPANVEHRPQIYDERDVTIQGVVVGLLRKYAR